jgi:DNA helicase HerA-like ATPase
MQSTEPASSYENAGVSESELKRSDALGLQRRLEIARQTLNPAVGEGASVSERRVSAPQRLIGRLVSLNGTRGVIDCRLDPAGEDWSVGHLITITHRNARLVGVVCEVATADGKWSEEEANLARVTFELGGEIIDQAADPPLFNRGVASFPSLGAIVHRIRAEDLRSIYTFRGKRGVEIGRLSQNSDIPAEVSIDQMIARHFAVLGSTGVGKTTAAAMLISSAIADRPNLRVLVLDPHNEYAAHFPGIAQVIDAENLELPIWMFRFDELADIVFSGRPPHSDERDALYEVIQTAKSNFHGGAVSATASLLRRKLSVDGAAVTADTPSPFRIADVLATIDEWLGKLEQPYPRSDLRALRARLEGLSRDHRYKFMFGGRSGFEEDVALVLSRIFRIPTAGLPITVVNLAGLPNEVVNSVVSVLARLAFEVAFWCSGSFEVALVCEEAHRYIPSGQGQDFAPVRRAIGRIAKEGRKYGASLCVISQRPSELDPTVLSQCSTTFAMRLPNENDKKIIADAVGASALSMIALLPSIADREAIAFGEAMAMPMRMKFSDVTLQSKERRPSASDAAPIDLTKLSRQFRDGTRNNKADPTGSP